LSRPVAYSLAGMPVLLERLLALLCGSLLAFGLAACGSGAVSSSFKGEEHEIAQAIANLQSDATVGEQKKICATVLSSALVKQLSPVKGGCAQAIKNQIAEVDSFTVNVKSVHVNSAAGQHTASASVTSIRQGKTRPSTVLLVKEGGKWKISGVQ
jgi:copper chaperone CopZ